MLCLSSPSKLEIPFELLHSVESSCTVSNSCLEDILCPRLSSTKAFVAHSRRLGGEVLAWGCVPFHAPYQDDGKPQTRYPPF